MKKTSLFALAILLFGGLCPAQNVDYFKSNGLYGLKNTQNGAIVVDATYDGRADEIGHHDGVNYYMLRKGNTLFMFSSRDYTNPIKRIDNIDPIESGFNYGFSGNGGKYYCYKRAGITEVWTIDSLFILDIRDGTIRFNGNDKASITIKGDNKTMTARLHVLEQQGTVLRHDINKDKEWGFWSNKKHSWVNKGRFAGRICDITTYNEPYSFDGKQFYIITVFDKGIKRILNADDLSFLGSIPDGQTIINGKTIQDIGVIVVKDYPYETWSLCDIYGNKIPGCKGWRKIIFSEKNREVEFQGYNYMTNKPIIIKETYTQLANEARKSMAVTEAEWSKKRQLASFKEYATAYIQPRITEWQMKSEFEKVEDYQRRVGGNNRQRKIDELSLEAEKLFIKENIETYKFTEDLSLGDYDSENEVFAIRSPRYGLLLIPVPLANAPSFKDGFKKAKIKKERFFIEKDKIAVAEFDIKVGRNTYHYTNNNSLNYVQYKFDPANLNLQDINIVSGKQSNNAERRPVVKIISPASGTQYQHSNVTFNIEVTPGDGKQVSLYVSINGADYVEINPVEQSSKGARLAKGKSYILNLPSTPGSEVNLAFQARDEYNIASEDQRVKMRYVGQVRKPQLILFAVGVGDYTSGDLTKLRYAAKDARDFSATIRQSNLSDYTGLKEHLYTDRQATRSNINKGLREVLAEAQSGDVVMFYFSGHGVQDGSETYFMTVDASSEAPSDEGVNFADLKNNMRKLTERQVKVVAFMDACHAGAMVGAKGAAPKLTELDVHNVIEFYSSTTGEESAEDEKLQNGVFTAGLISGLKGAAANADGYITVNTLRTYLSDYVRNKNSRQTPVFKGVDAGDITLFHKK